MNAEKKQNTEVAKVDPTKVPATMGSPALGRGHDAGMSQEDYEIPRARIVQFTSEEAQAEKVEDRIPPGTFINGMSKKILSVEFIPIKNYKTYTRWNPRKKDDVNYDSAYEPGDLIFQTTDRHDPKVVKGINFGPNGEPPAVTQSINFLCYFVGERIPLVLSFAKTSFRGGKRLNTLLMEAGGDMFSNKFKVVFSQQENAGAKYYVMDVRANGKASPEEFTLCEKWFNEFKDQSSIDSRVQQESAADHNPAAGDATAKETAGAWKD